MLAGLQTPSASVHSIQDPPEMNLIEDIEVVCPYCGSSFAIEADTEGGSYSTTEDCAVCCRPIALSHSLSSRRGRERGGSRDET